MTDLQQKEFDVLKVKVDTIEGTTNKIYQALVGSELTKDGGLVEKINEIEERQDEFRREIDQRITMIEKAYLKWRVLQLVLVLPAVSLGIW